MKPIVINLPVWYYHSTPLDLLVGKTILDQAGHPTDFLDLNHLFIDYVSDSSLLFKESLSDTFRQKKVFYDEHKLFQLYNTLSESYLLLSKAYAPTCVTHKSLRMRYDFRCFDDIKEATCDRRENPFIAYFEEIFERYDIMDKDLIALPFFHPDQIIPMFTFLAILKNRNAKAHVTLYGCLEDQINTVTMFDTSKVHSNIGIFDYFDSYILGDYTESLVSLADVIDKKSNMIDIANLVWIDRNSDQVSCNKIQSKGRAVLPDVEIGKLLAPVPVMDISTSVGCSWGRCTFCSICKNNPKYDQCDIEDVVLRIKKCNILYGVKHFRFRDTALCPNYVEELAKRILSEKLVVAWMFRARLEHKFNHELFTLLKKAGCCLISFGLETFHPRVSKLIRKGINLSYANTIISECDKAGIGVKLLTMVGIPTETREEIEYNRSQILKLKNNIISFRYNKFIMFRYSHIAMNSSRYNILLNNRKNQTLDFPIWLEYKQRDGLDDRKITDYHDTFYKTIINREFMFEEHLFLYLEKYGLKKVKQICSKIS